MTLESHFNEILEVLLSDQRGSPIVAEQLVHSIDLTLLDEQASIESLSQLGKEASTNEVAAICVYSKHLPLFHDLNGVLLATVINFPHGSEALSSSLAAIEKAIETGANEIDYVLPYQLYLAGQKQETLNRCLAVIELCEQHGATSKIILETGMFPDMQSIYEISKILSEFGCSFLKTSTGKLPQGASLSAAFAILSAIKDSNTSCGIKVSGGIKTPSQATNYATLAELIMSKNINKTWFRIGASTLLSELLK